ncbi:uncharacterized protein LOC142980453 [Anticarsia gemmatalis]|uniref:uncharacterized protein LOC142980453 n=1 Tax=Anticarsia gemmatalis TaxID=129554 RepID=UPI003F764BD0
MKKIELMRKSKANTKKILSKLEPDVQKELDARKRLKQLSRSLLPDAPPRKRQKKTSPERVDCRLTPGTPTTPPAPKLQPWELRKQQVDAAKASKLESDDHVLSRQDSCATPISTISTAESSVVGELTVDFTSGLLKSDERNWLCLPISKTSLQKPTDPTLITPAVKVDKAPPAKAPLAKAMNINMGSYSEKTESDLQKWLESMESDEDEDIVDVANIPSDGPTHILPHQMTTAYNFDEITTTCIPG